MTREAPQPLEGVQKDLRSSQSHGKGSRMSGVIDMVSFGML